MGGGTEQNRKKKYLTNMDNSVVTAGARGAVKEVTAGINGGGHDGTWGGEHVTVYR